MNPDYAHLLEGAMLDYRRLGAALKAVISARGVRLQDVQDQTRASRASVSRATAGIEISTGPLLLLCIWADLNPFELLRPHAEPGFGVGSSGDDGDYRVFHKKQPVKLSEKSRELRGKRTSARIARAR